MSDGGGGVPAPGHGVSVAPQQVHDVGVYLYELAETLSSALNSAGKDVSELLNGSWSGDYADEFGRGWTDVHEGGQRVFAALSSLAEKLGVTAESFTATDQGNAAGLGQPSFLDLS
ncbi:MAG: WXG100 family type VII secretion target [Nocardia sp.]|nr:WXG100 family type VII secretion target [Nocardia sp.]